MILRIHSESYPGMTGNDRFSPEMTEKTTENDREKRVIRKRLWNEMERNGMIFRIFSMIFHGYSVKIPYICIGLTK